MNLNSIHRKIFSRKLATRSLSLTHSMMQLVKDNFLNGDAAYFYWEKEDDEENNPPLLNGKVNFISLSTVLCAAIISSKAIEEQNFI